MHREVGESRKRDLHYAPCASASISFIPLLFESLDGLSSLTSQTISAICLHLAQRIGASSAITRRHLYQKCSISLWRGNAALWLHRINTIPPGVADIAAREGSPHNVSSSAMSLPTVCLVSKPAVFSTRIGGCGFTREKIQWNL